MYTVKLSDEAKKSLKKLDKSYRSSFVKAVERISKDPYLGKALAGEYKGLWRIRFSRYRIVYQIQRNKLIVLIINIRHRKDVYR